MTVTEMLWTLIALQAGTLFGAFFYLGTKIDHLGTRIDAQSARIDGLAVQLSLHLADPHPH
jgi:uncharacterized membrane protein YqgA involved in biofilm formation